MAPAKLVWAGPMLGPINGEHELKEKQVLGALAARTLPAKAFWRIGVR